MFIQTHQPCSHCGSSDGRAINTDGSSKCFVCNVFTIGNSETVQQPNRKKPMSALRYEKGISVSIADRRITKASAERYGVVRENNAYIFPYYNNSNTIVAVKYREIAEKKFTIDGEWADGLLFGQQLFPAGGKYITIVEGEMDALACFQMTGSKYPCVSIRNGAASAIKDCKKQYEYLNSFETIVVCFDGDEVGIKASREVAELFGSKAKVFKHLPEYKDACDWLKDSKEASFVQRWWSSEQYVPDGIVCGSSLWDAIAKPVAPADCLYPWTGLNALTYGIRKGELVCVTAGSGLGKSQTLKEIVWHLLQHTEDKIGLMFLEESVKKTSLSIMSLAANKPLHLPDVETNDEEKRNAFEATLGTDRIYLFDHFGSTSIDNIISRVRYMAKALDCKYVFVDHISIIISAQENGDERKAIDEIMTKLRMLVQETNIALIIVSHLKRPADKGHEEGAVTSLAQLRGSGSIAQLSDMVIGLERNGQAPDEQTRNLTHVRVLKNRYSGTTGPACQLLYNKHTGRMLEYIEEEPAL